MHTGQYRFRIFVATWMGPCPTSAAPKRWLSPPVPGQSQDQPGVVVQEIFVAFWDSRYAKSAQAFFEPKPRAPCAAASASLMPVVFGAVSCSRPRHAAAWCHVLTKTQGTSRDLTGRIAPVAGQSCPPHLMQEVQLQRRLGAATQAFGALGSMPIRKLAASAWPWHPK
jgi:hypothetical protein